MKVRVLLPGILFGFFGFLSCKTQHECCVWSNEYFIKCGDTSCRRILFDDLRGRHDVSVKLEASSTVNIRVMNGGIHKLIVKTEFQFETMCVKKEEMVEWSGQGESKTCAKESTTTTSTTRTTSASTIRTTSRRPTTSASTSRTTSQRRPTTSASTDSTTTTLRPTGTPWLPLGTTLRPFNTTVTPPSTTSTYFWTSTTTATPPNITTTHSWAFVFSPIVVVILGIVVTAIYICRRRRHAASTQAPDEETIPLSVYTNPTYTGPPVARTAAAAAASASKNRRGRSQIPRPRSPYNLRPRKEAEV